MKVIELPKDTNLIKVKVKLPDNVLKRYKDYIGGESEMWIIGFVMGDFFLSPDSPETNKRRLYPMPQLVQPSDILEWEVIE